MRFLCPHCHNPIELVGADGSDDVVCPSCGSSFTLGTPSTMTWRPPEGHRIVGRYQLLEVVGTGAHGTVYKSRDSQLDRIVAVKIPRAGSVGVADDRLRFL